MWRFVCIFTEGGKLIMGREIYYNENKLNPVPKEKAIKFKKILDDSNYRFIFNSLMGPIVNIDNWMDEIKILDMIKNIDKNDRDLLELLLLGYSKPVKNIEKLLKSEGVKFLLETNMFYKKDDFLNGNGYILLPVNELYLIVSLPCSYTNGKSQFCDIYIGQDSMRLQQMLKNKKFNMVLDLCAGSGVQGLHYVNTAKEVLAVELNDNAFVAATLNAYINGAMENYHVYKGDLYTALSSTTEKYDCIISNERELLGLIA